MAPLTAFNGGDDGTRGKGVFEVPGPPKRPAAVGSELAEELHLLKLKLWLSLAEELVQDQLKTQFLPEVVELEDIDFLVLLLLTS